MLFEQKLNTRDVFDGVLYVLRRNLRLRRNNCVLYFRTMNWRVMQGIEGVLWMLQVKFYMISSNLRKEAYDAPLIRSKVRTL